MKEFFNYLPWKTYFRYVFYIFAFFIVSYIAGNHKFPESIWTVPVGTILCGLMLLLEIYFKYTRERGNENGNTDNNKENNKT